MAEIMTVETKIQRALTVFFFMVFLSFACGVKISSADVNDVNSSAQETQETQHLYEQGKLYLRQGDPKEALEYFKMAYEKSSDLYDLNMDIGTSYFKIDRPEDSLKYLEKAAAIMPGKIAPNIAAGVSNMVLRNFEKAIFYFERATQIDSENPMPYDEMGAIYYLTNDLEKSKECFLKARELYRKDGNQEALRRTESRLRRIEAVE